MLIGKHLKLFRKLLGTVVRRRTGVANNLFKFAKFNYLFFSELVETVGDVVFCLRRSAVDEFGPPNRILVVKADQFGDVLFSTLLLPALKREFPKSQIDYLVRPGARPILAKNPHVGEIYEWHNLLLETLPGRGNRKLVLARIRENHKTAQILRTNQYDIVINARAYPPSSNYPIRSFGKKLIAFDISEQSFLADAWAAYDLDAEEWENYANLLAPLGIARSSISPLAEFYNYADNNPMEHSGPYVVISPVSFDEDRRWNQCHWTDLIMALVSRGFGVALTGMPSHREYLESILPPASERSSAVQVLVEMRLPEFGSLINGAAAFVGIDSFPAHLALAVRKRAVLFVNPAVYYLKGSSQQRFAREARCMLSRSPQIALFDIRSATPKEVLTFCLDG